jgi:excisionase family DNA binding protein
MTSSRNDDYQPGLEELISLNKAAEVSGLSHDHLRRLAERGQIWAIKLGRNWLTSEQAVRDYLANDRRPGPKKGH